jgi:hypothetical protein
MVFGANSAAPHAFGQKDLEVKVVNGAYGQRFQACYTETMFLCVCHDPCPSFSSAALSANGITPWLNPLVLSFGQSRFPGWAKSTLMGV